MEPTGAAPLRPTDLREIGPYRLLGRLGEGGMGTVFLARAPTGRFVALKVVKAEFANQEGFAARFHAEVENARRVASFCTAQVLDNGNTGDGRPYMVTEYIAGTPLSDQITQYGALEPGPLHGVALGVAAALAAIHVAGLVHRDLKPANVILSLSGPRVIDFGIARALDRDTGFTLSGELLGSPGWWAPEQVRGQTVSPAADIFAWGCLVAYSGNGRHPFGRGDPITLATRVLNNPPDLGVLPAPLDELVRRATAMEPHLRPTAQELLIALVGGSAPAAADVEPPTLVATEMLTDYGWQPPQNVVDEPDITATYTTPPPSDTTGRSLGSPAPGSAGRAPSLPGSAGQRPSLPDSVGRAPSLPGSFGKAVTSPGSADRAPSLPGSFGKAPTSPGTGGGSGGGDARGAGAPEELAAPESRPSVEELARREEQAAKEELARWEVPNRPQERGRGLLRRGRPAEEAQPAEQSAQFRQGALSGTQTQPGERAGQVAAPGGEPDTIGGSRTAGTRWLLAAGAAVLAIVVTTAVLIASSARDTAGTRANSTQVAATAGPNDVGRRFALGTDFDDPIAIVATAPVCGLREYEGRTATKGQLCVIRWSMINPGGERQLLIQPVVTMVDDQGGEHDPAPVTLPPAILPGGRVDSAFVFDLAMYRKPVKMTATMLENGQQIEVAL
ncbi:serine/threonine-protein kinase [Nonomuraea jiangxiensis]|uniref:Serine/threonine protein kinase n=1 Tax=Nonomuraea jiangxiensis TaxID=633440 RepID=A0A1G8NZC1_9ACTN|nr:serine/threonine-protein kinase [Nonomuraea jiangxiensis]SDI85612.1 Serine/threonine protein kinase [Nonomuraea jiangxiensis]